MWLWSDEGAELAAETFLLSFDTNGNGALDKTEFQPCIRALNSQMESISEEQIGLLQEQCDKMVDGDKISLEEFTALVKKSFAFIRKQRNIQ